jgi:hypothetical protein
LRASEAAKVMGVVQEMVGVTASAMAMVVAMG